MEVVIACNEHMVGELAADIVAAQLTPGGHPVIGLATGSSPLAAYRSLIERCLRGELSFADASAIMLDEYVGLPGDHPQTNRNVIRRDFVDSIDLPLERLYCPRADSEDLDAACSDYDQLVSSVEVDVQLLGIGSNGHLAFNEPGSSFASRTRVKTLAEQTRRDNARFFPSLDEVPQHVVTQGLATLLQARHLVLVASGPAKAAPIAAAVEGPVTAMCPASVLQLHPHATVLIDEQASADLQLSGYYQKTLEHKPAWQSF
ncbi:MAG: glucosamine-6-phosphate deaminase [bacterium]|nr:glucosamine-6-phosphate deaminase [bacterium]